MRTLTDWLLTPERVAVHGPTATAVVADLHLGYDLIRRRAGEAVPAVDLNDVLAGLRRALVRHGVGRLIIAGDLFEDGRHGGEMVVELVRWLERVGVELVGVVPGNHDRQGGEMRGLGPFFPAGAVLGSWRIVHGDGRLPPGRVVHGHFHPGLRLAGATVPCYLVGERRLVLPAYSAEAAGVQVIGSSMWRGLRCYAIAGERVLDFGPVGELGRLRRGARRSTASGEIPYQYRMRQ